MKVLDLAVASMIGFASLAVMGIWNPEQLSAQATIYSQQASMEEYLLSVSSNLGLPWLQQASSRSLCSALALLSNSSIQVSASGRFFVCSTGPPLTSPRATVVLEFPTGNISLSAWHPEKR